jgi:DNA-binding transcriptional LysR family regulator
MNPLELDWDDVRLFLAAARHAGFGAAARHLGTRQSTVSRRVASLERALGASLFDRTPTGLELTQVGRRVLGEAGRAEASLRGVADAVAQESGEVSGLVRLALTETVASVFVLPRVLPGLLKAHPGLTVDLVASDDAADLARREADIAIRFFLPTRGDLVARRVARLPTAPLATRRLARRLAGAGPETWPWVGVWRAAGPPVEERWAESFHPKPRLTTNSFHTQFEAVRAGLGVAVLPTALRVADPALQVLALPAPGAAPTLDIYLVTPRTLRRVPRVAAVFDALAAEFARAAA